MCMCGYFTLQWKDVRLILIPPQPTILNIVLAGAGLMVVGSKAVVVTSYKT